jgi:hypothetical protein
LSKTVIYVGDEAPMLYLLTHGFGALHPLIPNPRLIDTTVVPCYDRMGSRPNFLTLLALSLKKRKLSEKS